MFIVYPDRARADRVCRQRFRSYALHFVADHSPSGSVCCALRTERRSTTFDSSYPRVNGCRQNVIVIASRFLRRRSRR
jgi:hypothetical protein